MQCPKCSVEMKEYKDRENVLVDYCYDGCKSIWFDNSELAILSTTESNHPDFGAIKAKGEATSNQCPRCPEENLFEVPYVAGHDLMIDVCPSCTGVFLDAKELGALQRLAASQEPRAVRLKRAAKRMQDAGFMILNSGNDK